MNKLSIITILLTVLMSMVGTNAYATISYDISVVNSDGVTIYYRWINNKTELSVSFQAIQYIMNWETYHEEEKYISNYTGIVIIPASVEYEGKTYSVTSIGYKAFIDCKGLTSVIIPSSVTKIEYLAFYGCNSLSFISIPNSVTEIGWEAFSETAWYNNQPSGLVYAGNVAYNYKGTMPNNTSIIIKDGTVGIGDEAFRNCNGLTSITIPNSVTSIGNSAFRNCSGLTSITIPNNVTSIGGGAFGGCTGLTSITIPNSVTSIGNNAFQNCSGLTSLTIGNSVTLIGGDAFSGCSGLTSITIPNNVTSIGYGAFAGCSSLTAVTIQGNIESNYVYSNQFPFINCLKLKEMVFNCEKVSNIAKGITTLETVTFGESVKEIGIQAFQGCSGIKSITFPSSVNTIGDYAFSGCSLSSVTIPNSVNTIGNYAFSGCSLSSVTIPGSVTSFGKCVFQECTELLTVTSYLTEPNTAGYGNNSSHVGFSENTYRKGTLFVPAGTKELYLRFDGWKEFLKIVEMAGEEQTFLTILNGDEEVAKLKVKQGENYTWQIPSTDHHKLASLYFNDALVTDQLSEDGIYTTPAIITSSILKMIYEDDAQKRGDVNRDGEVNVADHVELSKIIMSQDNIIGE